MKSALNVLLATFLLLGSSITFSQSDASKYLNQQLDQAVSDRTGAKLILPVVVQDSLWRYINDKGTFYSDEVFEEASLLMNSSQVVVKKKGKCGVISFNKGFDRFDIIIPYRYDSITYSMGLYSCWKQGSYSLIRSDKKRLFQNKKLQAHYLTDKFLIAVDHEGRYALMKGTSLQLLPFKYEFIHLLNDNFAVLGAGGKTQAYSTTKNKFTAYSKNSIALENDTVLRIKEAGQWTYYRKNLSPLPHTGNSTTIILPFNFYKVKQDSIRWKLYRFSDGKEMFTHGRYDNFYPQTKHRISVLQQGAIGMINREDELMVPFHYDHIERLVGDSLFLVHQDFNYGVINQSGDTVVPMDYKFIKRISYSSNVFIHVQDSSKVGIYGLTGDTIVPVKYDDVLLLPRSSLFVTSKGKENTKYGFYSYTGKELLSPRFDKACWINKKYSIVRNEFEQVLITSSDSLFSTNINKYTQYKDVFKIYHNDSITFVYLDTLGMLKGKYSYGNFKSYEFGKKPLVPEYKPLSYKIRPVMRNKLNFIQTVGKWGIVDHGKSKIIGKPKWEKVVSTRAGKVYVNPDSTSTFSLGKLKVKTLSSVCLLNNFGEFYPNSFAINARSSRARRDDIIPTNLSNLVCSDGRSRYLFEEKPTAPGWDFMFPKMEKNLQMMVTESSLTEVDKDADITYSEYLQEYNDGYNLVPASYEDYKLLAKRSKGVKIRKGKWSFKMDHLHNANNFGALPSDGIEVLTNGQIKSKDSDGWYRYIPLSSFKGKAALDSALEEKYFDVQDLQPPHLKKKNISAQGYIYSKYNRSMNLMKIKQKKQYLDKYYADVKCIHEQHYIVRWYDDSYQLLDENENQLTEKPFKEIGSFNPKGVFAGKIQRRWALYNANGTKLCADIFKQCEKDHHDLFWAKAEKGEGYLSSKGDTIIPFNYRIIQRFRDSRIPYCIAKNKKGRYFVLNTEGDIVFETKKRLKKLLNKNLVVYYSGEKKKKILDMNLGENLNMPKIGKVKNVVGSIATVVKGEEKKYYNLSTQKFIGNVDKGMSNFSENGYAVIKRNNQMVLIDSTGTTLKTLAKSYFKDFGAVYECYESKDQLSVFTDQGKQIPWDKQHRIKGGFTKKLRCGVVIVDSSRKQFLMDDQGRQLSGLYDLITFTSYGTAVVSIGNKKGLINLKGKEILPVNFRELIQLSETDIAYAPLKFTGAKIRFTPTRAKKEIAPTYDELYYVSKDMIQMKNHLGKVGYMKYMNDDRTGDKLEIIWDLNQ